MGHPIDHSLSPLMQNASMKAINYDGVYLALNIHPNEIIKTLPVMGKIGLKA